MNSSQLQVRVRVPLDSFDLNLDFQSSSQAVGIFGPSGSGKSTLLRVIAGIQRKITGKISFDGKPWLDSQNGFDLQTSQRNIGYVPQNHLLFPHWNVLKNLESGMRRHSSAPKEATNFRDEIIALLEMSPLLSRLPDQLSGGERQRVALGRALCSKPDLLLLDEPLASLDDQLKRRILPFLGKIKTSLNIPILIVSHNPTELLSICDEIVAIEKGKLVSRGRPSEVFSNPNVYANASRERYQNIMTTNVEKNSTNFSTVRLGSLQTSPTMKIPKISLAENSTLLIGIASSEILVATQTFSGISARNQLSATIEKITQLSHQILLSATVDNSDVPPLMVELTPDAVEELKLVPGSRIQLLFKSSSVDLFY